MSKKIVDTKRAVAMHKVGRTVGEIARFFRVQEAAIYRAFRIHGYETPGMIERRLREPEEKRLPPAHKNNGQAASALPPLAANDLVGPPPRYTCVRCGARSDAGCRHVSDGTAEKIGWHVG